MRLSTIPTDDFARIFGTPGETRETGRSRLCRHCGDWHRLDRPVPHNCREPAPPHAEFATPMIAPKFGAFQTAPGHDDGINEVVSTRRQKREFMARHDLVEYDAGVGKKPVEFREQWRQKFAADFERALQTDPLSVPPIDRIGETDLGGAPEIKTDGMKVFTAKGEETVPNG